MDKNSKIYVAGNTGLVGSAICRCLNSKGYNNLVFTEYPEWDLRDQCQVEKFFATEKPEFVILAAAKVGGILANNTYPAEFIYDNLMIECNVIHAAHKHGVKKLLFLGSSCIYPKLCDQPIKEEYLLTGSLEPTNEAYALAKISGLKMCQYYRRQYGDDFISAMPTNLYGPHDNFNLETSHVLPAMIRKMHLAKAISENDYAAVRKDLDHLPIPQMNGKKASEFTDEELVKMLEKYGLKYENELELHLWGTGKPMREFLYVDDLAEALVYMVENYSADSHLNVGTGKDLTIKELAELVADVVGYKGIISWDSDKPDGTPRKLLDVTKINEAGWKERVSLREGIGLSFSAYLNNQ